MIYRQGHQHIGHIAQMITIRTTAMQSKNNFHFNRAIYSLYILRLFFDYSLTILCLFFDYQHLSSSEYVPVSGSSISSKMASQTCTVCGKLHVLFPNVYNRRAATAYLPSSNAAQKHRAKYTHMYGEDGEDGGEDGEDGEDGEVLVRHDKRG